MDNLCVICGRIIPEGRQVCHYCEKEAMRDDSLVGRSDSVFSRGRYRRFADRLINGKRIEKG